MLRRKRGTLYLVTNAFFVLFFYIIGLQAISLMLLQKELNKIARKDRLLQQQRAGYLQREY